MTAQPSADVACAPAQTVDAAPAIDLAVLAALESKYSLLLPPAGVPKAWRTDILLAAYA
jgi:hypothetical protein